MRTHFLLFDVGIARLTFQIRPHQYFQCFDFFFSVGVGQYNIILDVTSLSYLLLLLFQGYKDTYSIHFTEHVSISRFNMSHKCY